MFHLGALLAEIKKAITRLLEEVPATMYILSQGNKFPGKRIHTKH